MREKLRVAIAEDEPELLEDLSETITRMGHDVIIQARDGQELVELCSSEPPQMIVTDIKMPNMDGLEASKRICQTRAVPVIVVTAYGDDEFVRRSLADHVLAYLVKPVNEQTLSATIAVAMQRFREFEALHKQCNDLRQALEDRKVLERAKGVVMKRAKLTEEEAFRRLQQTASKHNRKLIDVAQSVLTSEEVCDAD